LSSGTVIIENAAHVAIASVDVSGTYTAANFALGDDGSGHLLASYAATPASAAIEGAGGLYNGVFGADSLLPPVPGAETHGGEFDFRHEAYAGSARDAWSVSWDAAIGHGPGPGG
jgi:hypothetical protein